jgi:hypothetical protein
MISLLAVVAGAWYNFWIQLQWNYYTQFVNTWNAGDFLGGQMYWALFSSVMAYTQFLQALGLTWL